MIITLLGMRIEYRVLFLSSPPSGTGPVMIDMN